MVDKDTDICICIDLDEILLPGWRKILEQNWKEDTTRVYYTYNWKLDNNNRPLVTFILIKYTNVMVINGFIQSMKY